uniref:Uncharacterized protein n=1 Tax=Helianthus annuus TaxID=4232 RepID=A0A251T543_HELAN
MISFFIAITIFYCLYYLFDTYQWYQSRRDPPTMVAHTLSETEFYQWMNESLAKLESQLQTLLNEFRSIRTKWEAPQTNIQSPTPPTPISTTAQPVPLPATTTVKPNPKSTTFGQLTTVSDAVPPPKQSPLANPLAPTPAPTSSSEPSQPFPDSNKLLQVINKPALCEAINKSNFGLEVEDLEVDLLVHPCSKENEYYVNDSKYNTFHHMGSADVAYGCYASIAEKINLVPLEMDEKDKAEGATNGRREWRPPWRPVETAPNAIGRIEWRPPWRIFFPFLRTRTFSTGRDCCVPLSTKPRNPCKTQFDTYQWYQSRRDPPDHGCSHSIRNRVLPMDERIPCEARVSVANPSQRVPIDSNQVGSPPNQYPISYTPTPISTTAQPVPLPATTTVKPNPKSTTFGQLTTVSDAVPPPKQSPLANPLAPTPAPTSSSEPSQPFPDSNKLLQVINKPALWEAINKSNFGLEVEDLEVDLLVHPCSKENEYYVNDSNTTLFTIWEVQMLLMGVMQFFLVFSSISLDSGLILITLLYVKLNKLYVQPEATSHSSILHISLYFN